MDLALGATEAEEGSEVVLTIDLRGERVDLQHDLQISWPDGHNETILMNAGQSEVIARRLFPDDDPSGTPFDIVEIEVTATEVPRVGEQPRQATKSVDTVIHNVAPEVSPIAVVAGATGVNGEIQLDDVVDFAFSFTDVGVDDTFPTATATVTDPLGNIVDEQFLWRGCSRL